MLINLLLIIVGFGALIFIHELGHFLAARWAGIRTEAFAIGMMHPILAWRKGIGFALGSTRGKVIARTGKEPRELSDDELRIFGVGETEYSLRWLPLGGFVKMLGQDDADPSYQSSDPRSYNRCPVGKRMIVISAGVVANAMLAVVLFIIAFMAGVRFPAAVIGEVSDTMPAGMTSAENAAELGVAGVGLQPGDVVTMIDGKPVRQFADVQIAAAMGRAGVPLRMTVRREGVADPLHFPITPVLSPESGLLSIGVAPAASARLQEDGDGVVGRLLDRAGLASAGVRSGMQLISAQGQSISTYEQLARLVRRSEGRPLQTQWSAVGPDGTPAGPTISATLQVRPQLQLLRYADPSDDRAVNYERGLLGLTPAVRIQEVLEGSINRGVLHEGDVLLRVGDLHAPRIADVFETVRRHPGGPIELVVRRGEDEVRLTAQVNRQGVFRREGKLNVMLGAAEDLPIVAAPMDRIRTAPRDGKSGMAVPSPAAPLRLLPGTRIEAVDDQPVHDWASLRAGLQAAAPDPAAEDAGATVRLTVTHPTPGHERQTINWELSAEDVAAVRELGWAADLPPDIFEPIEIVRDAGGNPLRAIAMGLEETHKLIMLTYLTIDRLFRGSVGVEQLRGPVGIVHIGAHVADRGLTYLIFFMAMISINLAVLNFLPLPIVDGGQFLFLVYEKVRGRPPSVAFQNLATIAGLILIGSIFLVTFYYDLARLIG